MSSRRRAPSATANTTLDNLDSERLRAAQQHPNAARRAASAVTHTDTPIRRARERSALATDIYLLDQPALPLDDVAKECVVCGALDLQLLKSLRASKATLGVRVARYDRWATAAVRAVAR